MAKWKRYLLSGVFAVMFFGQTVFGETAVDLGPIIVTGTRMEQSSGQSGGNVTVLGAREIADSGAADLAGLIQSAAGVFVTQKSTARSGIADIRGFGDTADRNVLILVNGRKINSVDNAAVDLSMIPLEAVERVEILRGAGSVMYGDNAVGGVINIITKKGRGPVRGSIGTVLGPYGTRRATAEASGSEGQLSYFLLSRYADDRGYRANSDHDARDGNLRLDYEASDRLSLGFDAAWHEDSYGLPGGLNAAGLAQYGRRGSDEESNFGKTRDRTFGLTAGLRPWSDPSIDGKVSVDYAFRNQDSFGWFDYGFGMADAIKRKIDTHALLTQYHQAGDLGERAYSIVIGTDLYDVRNDILDVSFGPWGGEDDLTISKKEAGVYAYGELEVMPRVFAGTGLRYQKADYTFDQRSGAPQYIATDPSETVKKGLIRYEYAAGSNVYFSAEETFRFLSTDEWYSKYAGLNTSLKHQTGVQYEIGWKHDLNGLVQTSVVPYWIANENEIFLDPSVSPGNNANYDKTLRRGVELSGRVDLLKAADADAFSEWSLLLDYGYQEAQFRAGAFSGRDVPMAPRHQAGLRMSARLKNGLGLSVGQRMTGSRYAINDTENRMRREKAYYVTNLRLSFHQPNWEIFGAVNNLFGREYNDYVVKSTGASDNIEYYPAAERQFEAGIRVRF